MLKLRALPHIAMESMWPSNVGSGALLPCAIMRWITQRAELSAYRRGLGDRHVLPLRSRDPAGRRQAVSPWSRRQGRRTVTCIRLFRRQRPWRSIFGHQFAVRLPRPFSRVSGQKIHSEGGRHRRRDRCPGDLPAGPSRAYDRGHTVVSAAPERAFRLQITGARLACAVPCKNPRCALLAVATIVRISLAASGSCELVAVVREPSRDGTRRSSRRRSG